MYTDEDKDQISSKGLSIQDINEQLRNFREGFPYLEILHPATPGNGLLQISGNDEDAIIESFEKNKAGLSILKFVPASGAASRMFKSLFECNEQLNSTQDVDAKMEILNKYPDVKEVFEKIDFFAFKEDIDKILEKEKSSVKELLEDKNYSLLIQCILGSKGLNYGFLPKGLIKFHHYFDENRTPMEEHFVEGALYAKDTKDEVHFHFTVSPEHKVFFDDRLRKTLPEIIESFGGKYEVDFSFQKKSTDTIAVDMNNQPFRETNGELLFRPGGHGALLENLNDVKVEIVFIKNIDNVAPDRLKEQTVRFKKILGGILLDYRAKIFNYLEKLDSRVGDEDGLHGEIRDFLMNDLNIEPGTNILCIEDETSYFKTKLNRPIRVCGMVRNLGEPGGGPFIVRNSDGTASPQIVETSQIDLELKESQEMLEKATHFNPVDLVCSLRNYKGEKFNLLDFRDMNTGFISHKSKDGRDLKALELPGLWNGAMSDWNTVFVEVPIETFSPVKTINDLLRKEHQA